VFLDGRTYRIRFERGEVVRAVAGSGAPAEGKRGSRVSFMPDPAVFKDIEGGFDHARMKRRLRELAYLTGGVKIVLEDRRHADCAATSSSRAAEWRPSPRASPATTSGSTSAPSASVTP
jgi:DNA gyrase/topoisomerase IV subunit B